MSTTYDGPTEIFDAVLPSGAPATDAPKPRKRRIRGLKISAVPSWPLMAQVGGGVSALCGVYAQFGGAVTLIVAGVAALGLGTLREAGRI